MDAIKIRLKVEKEGVDYIIELSEERLKEFREIRNILNNWEEGEGGKTFFRIFREYKELIKKVENILMNVKHQYNVMFKDSLYISQLMSKEEEKENGNQ